MLAKQNSCLVDVLLRICYSASSVRLDNFSTLFLYLPCLLRKSAVRSLTRDFRHLKTNQTGPDAPDTWEQPKTHQTKQTQSSHSVIVTHLKYTTLYEERVLLIWWTWNLLQINPRLFSANLSRLSFHLNSSLFPPKILEEDFTQNFKSINTD